MYLRRDVLFANLILQQKKKKEKNPRTTSFRIAKLRRRNAGLPDVIFSNQYSDLGKFWKFLQWKVLVHKLYMRPFCLFYGYRGYFVAIWLFLWLFDMSFTRFGMLHQQNLATLPECRQPCLHSKNADVQYLFPFTAAP
jgi:hypothetical protein